MTLITNKSEIKQKGAFKDVMVSKENILYMNLPSITKGLSTKSGSGNDGDLVSLESLLDRGRMEELDFNHRHITQIPFIEVESNLDVSIQDSLNSVIRPEDITIVKKYLLEVIDTAANKVRTYIAALIPSKAYLDQYGADSFNYLDKGKFRGIILYSNLDGSCRNVCFYRGGPIRLGDVIDPGQKDLYSRVKVINLVRKSPETRSSSSDDDGIYGGEIAGSVCVAEKETTRMRVDEDDEWKSEVHDYGKGGGGGGSGGGSGKTGDSGSDSGSDSRHGDDSRTIFDTLMPSFIIADTSSSVSYKVNLFKGGTGDGYVRGEGVYEKDEVVICNAWAYTGSDFDRWTGDLNGEDFNVTFKAEKDISATAYFINIFYTPGVLRPCFSLLRGVGNPLVNMTIASPGWTGWKGGTYGYVRYDKHGNKKMHNGLDLSANVGTEVYAMIDGVIGGKYVTEQPNRSDSDEYPDGYKGDNNGAGNRINIIGHINGSTVQIGYWHLMAGNPVAINPRTGSPYKKGDRVFRGEVVAYTGRTGNAYNVKEKHLHLAYYKISSNGTRRSANPEELINGNVNWSDNHCKVLTPDIKGIICDEEKKDNISVFTIK